MPEGEGLTLPSPAGAAAPGERKVNWGTVPAVDGGEKALIPPEQLGVPLSLGIKF